MASIAEEAAQSAGDTVVSTAGTTDWTGATAAREGLGVAFNEVGASAARFASVLLEGYKS